MVLQCCNRPVLDVAPVLRCLYVPASLCCDDFAAAAAAVVSQMKRLFRYKNKMRIKEHNAASAKK
jgi:hypothetical protein